MKFIASETNTYRMVGLAEGDAHASYEDIEYAWYPNISGTLDIHESGGYRATLSP